MVRFIIVAVVFALSLGFSPDLCAQLKESDYADLIQSDLGGEREVAVTSGRVDLVTDTHAYEIEWANKWKDGVGQALWYGMQTNKKPGIILIMRPGKTDFKYVQQLESALMWAEIRDKVDVRIWSGDGWVGE